MGVRVTMTSWDDSDNAHDVVKDYNSANDWEVTQDPEAFRIDVIERDGNNNPNKDRVVASFTNVARVKFIEAYESPEDEDE